MRSGGYSTRDRSDTDQQDKRVLREMLTMEGRRGVCDGLFDTCDTIEYEAPNIERGAALQ